jgi:ATP-dependent HslUV protease subunit HslV
VVIANAERHLRLYSYREVFEFKEFWGIGSGRSFALGAMHAAYIKAKTAKEVAEAGMPPAASSTAIRPAGRRFTLKLKVSK